MRCSLHCTALFRRVVLSLRACMCWIPSLVFVYGRVCGRQTGLPEMEIAWKTNLGFHHEENEDKATVVEDLFREFPPTHDKPVSKPTKNERRREWVRE